MKSLVLALALGVPGAPAEPAHVSVVATEYAFVGFPGSIAAGPTTFSFENRGEVRHEMTIILLRPGLTVKDVMAAGTSPTGPKTAESLVGLLIARKHESAGGQLLVNLQSGRRYLVICSLRDTPDAQQHSMLGMVTTFEVP
jgi:hypothetical protein